MNIEKTGENQIRCFISKDELDSRNIKPSEIAYGTEKIKLLFKEVMQFANKEYGFSAENYPIMVEATPLTHGGLLVLITKVEFPDELDSRFAYFSDSDISESDASGIPFGSFGKPSKPFSLPKSNSARDIINICSDFSVNKDLLSRHYIFNTLDDVEKASHIICHHYHASNSLYKDSSGKFHLILNIGNHTAEEFNKICNSLAEYGVMEPPEHISYKKTIEHAKLIIANNAISMLSKL